jgi:hypothetical protein
VQGDRAEAEAAIAHVAQAGSRHHPGELGRGDEALDRFGQVGVGGAVTGDGGPDEGLAIASRRYQ